MGGTWWFFWNTNKNPGPNRAFEVDDLPKKFPRKSRWCHVEAKGKQFSLQKKQTKLRLLKGEPFSGNADLIRFFVMRNRQFGRFKLVTLVSDKEMISMLKTYWMSLFVKNNIISIYQHKIWSLTPYLSLYLHQSWYYWKIYFSIFWAILAADPGGICHLRRFDWRAVLCWDAGCLKNGIVYKYIMSQIDIYIYTCIFLIHTICVYINLYLSIYIYMYIYINVQSI